ncbi:hypothetical protein KI387_035553 [Taxus chinensis]|uniref:Uncharacterized protein n=1 Tax=Taxus chinensis TaxID=29808 RepID=A0AA38L0C6_TAXCH|nr:hypothetical protein KI387_035553 [Taxus chinensis]
MKKSKCSKIRDVLRLTQISRKWRNLVSARNTALGSHSRKISALSSWFSSIFHHENGEGRVSNPRCGVPADVPAGHLAVYVGKQCTRFVIRATYLNRPVFRTLLEAAEEEFGYDYEGGLAIPCDELLFQHILGLFSGNDPSTEQPLNLGELQRILYVSSNRDSGFSVVRTPDQKNLGFVFVKSSSSVLKMKGSKCSKIRDALRLTQISRKWRNLVSARNTALGSHSRKISALPSWFSSIFHHGNGAGRDSNPRRGVPADVPAGHLAVYVGKQCTRFVIRATYLNRPVFRTLLEAAEEEFGYDYEGGLAVPCDEPLFQHILGLFSRNDPATEKPLNLEDLQRRLYGKSE